MSTFNAVAELFIHDSPRLIAKNLKANVDKLWWNSVFVTRPLTPCSFLEFSLPTYSVLITFKSLWSLCLSFLVATVLWEWGWTELLWSHAEDHSTQLTAKGQVEGEEEEKFQQFTPWELSAPHLSSTLSVIEKYL